ncbi:MAG: hypothetical protein WB789_00515 [Thermoplasmata archaeon]
MSPSSRKRNRRLRATVATILGVALVVSGVVLLFVPVVPQRSHTEALEFPPGIDY